MSVTYLIGALCFPPSPLNESQEWGKWDLCQGGGAEKVKGPTPDRLWVSNESRDNLLCLDPGAWMGRPREGHSPLPLPFLYPDPGIKYRGL